MLQLKQHPSIHKQINMLLIYVVVIEWTGHIKIMSGLIKPLQLSRHERHVVPYLYHLIYTLRWRHNGRDSVSNHQPRDCLLNRLFRRRSKKRLKLRVTGHCAGNSPWTGEFPAQWRVTRKMFPFDDVIMQLVCLDDEQTLNLRVCCPLSHTTFYHHGKHSHVMISWCVNELWELWNTECV